VIFLVCKWKPLDPSVYKGVVKWRIVFIFSIEHGKRGATMDVSGSADTFSSLACCGRANHALRLALDLNSRGMMSETNNAAFIWSIANLLRGPYKQADYGKVILPFTILRRLDSALESTKPEVLRVFDQEKSSPALDFLLQQASGFSFYNKSPYDLKRAAGDSSNLKANLVSYIEGFSPNVRDIFERYEFSAQLGKLDENDLLLLVTQKFSQLDLHPSSVSNVEMGLIFEELIRKFAEASNETAGEHFTPRDVVRLIVNLLFSSDDEVLSKPGVVRSVYDPTAGTGGMLSVADEYIRHLNAEATLVLSGQELNDESYAIAKADMVIKGQDIANIVWGDTLTNDGHFGKTFDYCLSNPPFGVEWKSQREYVEREHKDRGFDGRFGPGLPRINDGALLFLMHLIKKMRPATEGGGRAAIILQPGPLQTGKPEKGESNIRQYLFQQDLVDAIIAVPPNMFYNTPIQTYVLILDNKKPAHKKGKVLLVDGTKFASRLPKNFGDKTHFISDDSIGLITRLYDANTNGSQSKVLEIEDFKYVQFPIHRALRISYLISESSVEVAIESKDFSRRTLIEREAIKSVLAEYHGEANKRSKVLFSIEEALKQLPNCRQLAKAEIKTLDKVFGVQDELGEVALDLAGKPLPDKELDEDLLLPAALDYEHYFNEEVLPYAPDAWFSQEEVKDWWGMLFKQHLNSVEPPSDALDFAKSLDVLVREARSKLDLHRLQELKISQNLIDSGVSWLGAIPSTWSVAPSRSLFYSPNEKSRPEDIHLTPSQKYGVLSQEDYMAISGSRVVLTLSDNAQMKHVEPLDFISHLRSFQGGFELATIAGKVSGAYTVFRSRSEQEPNFWRYLFKSHTYINALQTTTDSLRDGQSIRFREFSMVPLPIVPIRDQVLIAKFINQVVDTLSILRETPEIVALRENIIANAVTGKLDLQEFDLG
jgi:type I restriction enzyme M protein